MYGIATICSWLAQSENGVGRKMSNTGWLYLLDFTSY